MNYIDLKFTPKITIFSNTLNTYLENVNRKIKCMIFNLQSLHQHTLNKPCYPDAQKIHKIFWKNLTNAERNEIKEILCHNPTIYYSGEIEPFTENGEPTGGRCDDDCTFEKCVPSCPNIAFLKQCPTSFTWNKGWLGFSHDMLSTYQLSFDIEELS